MSGARAGGPGPGAAAPTRPRPGTRACQHPRIASTMSGHDEAGEHGIKLFKGREDEAAAFQAVEQTLDFMAAPVHLAIVFPGIHAGSRRRLDRGKSQVQRQLTRFVPLAGAVDDQRRLAVRRAQTRCSSFRPSGASWACPGGSANVRAEHPRQPDEAWGSSLRGICGRFAGRVFPGLFS